MSGSPKITPQKIRRRFPQSIQADSLALRSRIARARRAEHVRRTGHWAIR